MSYDVVIVGGGASGIATAIMCARHSLKTLVLECNDRILKKVLATGNGKCNFSNVNISADNYNTPFVSSALSNFTTKDSIDFFASLGLMSTVDGDRVYPYSKQASSVIFALMQGIESPLITVKTGEKVLSIDKGFVVKTDKERYDAKCVVLATGSNATTGTMSHRLYEQFGHKSTICMPSLTYLMCDKAYVTGLNGIRIKAAATIKVGDKNITRAGELLFKNNAISGIMVFELSSYFARNVVSQKVVTIDMMPDISRRDLKAFFESVNGDTLTRLMGVLPKQLAILVSKLANNDINRAIDIVKGYQVPILGVGDIKNAQVVSGGLEVNGFDAHTLESKYIEDLYATGEVLDVDGDCGGYNLHWAWASAKAVADSIGKKYGKN